jgi:hypothetical protein
METSPPPPTPASSTNEDYGFLPIHTTIIPHQYSHTHTHTHTHTTNKMEGTTKSVDVPPTLEDHNHAVESHSTSSITSSSTGIPIPTVPIAAMAEEETTVGTNKNGSTDNNDGGENNKNDSIDDGVDVDENSDDKVILPQQQQNVDANEDGSEHFDDDDDDDDDFDEDEDDYSDDDASDQDDEDGIVNGNGDTENGVNSINNVGNNKKVVESNDDVGLSTSEMQKTRRRGDDGTMDDSPPKRAKIAIPPAIPSILLDVDEYKLDESPDAPPSITTSTTSSEESSTATATATATTTSDPTTSSTTTTTTTTPMNADVDRINTPNLILFGLHPLVKEKPLQKLCEHYGTVTSMTVRSAFANRYGHVGYETIEQARTAYVALNGAKLFTKTILVQPAATSSSSVS